MFERCPVASVSMIAHVNNGRYFFSRFVGMTNERDRNGVYNWLLFPWLCHRALDQPLVANHRQELMSQVRGERLDSGPV